MEVTKPIKVGNIWTNLISNETGESVNYEGVSTWWDGSPMDDSKVDGEVYRKLPSSVGGGYVRKVYPDFGGVFLEKDSAAELRNLNQTEILLLKIGRYRGVTLNGYYTKGDTPAPIQYYLSNTVKEDDGGSVFEVGGVKLEHDFVEEVDVRYFGASESVDCSDKIQNAVNSSSGSVIIPMGTYLCNSQIVLKSNIKISGCGLDNSVLIRDAQTPNSSFFYGENLENVSVLNLTMEGCTDSVDTPGYSAWNCGCRFDTSYNVNIKNISVSKMSSGVQLYYGDGAVVSNSYFKDNILTGISAINHNTRVCKNTFYQNGRVTTGLTHDVYFINSNNVFISDNDFLNHVDPVSYNLVYKWSGDETVNSDYLTAENCVIKNNFFNGNFSIDVVSQRATSGDEVGKTIKNVEVSYNISSEGRFRFVNVENSRSFCNLCGDLNFRSRPTPEGDITSFSSSNDSLYTITIASTLDVAPTDKDNICFINTSFLTNENINIVRFDSGWGGRPACTIINPIINKSVLSAFDATVITNVTNGYVIVKSSEYLPFFENSISFSEVATEYTPDNTKQGGNLFRYQINSPTGTIINNPINVGVEGSIIEFLLYKVGTPNFQEITFGSSYVLSSRTRANLRANTQFSIIYLKFIKIDTSWIDISDNSFNGVNGAFSGPVTETSRLITSPSQGFLPYDVIGRFEPTDNMTVVLPPASSNNGRVLKAIKMNSTPDTVTFNPSSGDVIYSAGGNYVLTTQYETVTFISDGIGWMVL